MKIHFTSVKGRRDANEDRHNIIININGDNLEINPINLFGIYDGHGGSWVSSYLEKNLPNYYLNKKFTPPFLSNYHNQVFEIVQSQLLKNPDNYGYSMGSTCLLNIMYKFENAIHMNIVNLGDSRMAIVYKNFDSKQITTDHKPDDINEKKRLETMGGDVYQDSEGVCRIGDLSLSRAFGDEDNAPYISQKPDVFYKTIGADTKFIVMACDGLWDVIESADIGKIIKKIIDTDTNTNTNTKNIAIELANYALLKGSTDNVSIIIIEISE